MTVVVVVVGLKIWITVCVWVVKVILLYFGFAHHGQNSRLYVVWNFRRQYVVHIWWLDEFGLPNNTPLFNIPAKI